MGGEKSKKLNYFYFSHLVVPHIFRHSSDRVTTRLTKILTVQDILVYFGMVTTNICTASCLLKYIFIYLFFCFILISWLNLLAILVL